jgi:two-component system, cell cycle response regulator CpdR
MARILIADDEVSGRDLTRAMLEAAGHAVACADNGADALAALTAGPFDLLISDIQMPEMDGLTLAAKALEQRPSLRVILMSGYADGFAKAEALKPRLRAVLAKPVAAADLKAAVAAALA